MFKTIFKDSKVYDILKWLASPGLPALAVFLIGASKLWNLPILALVGGTVSLIAAMFGEWTHQSSKAYWAIQQTGGDEGEEKVVSEEEDDDEIEEDQNGEQDSDE